MKKRNVYIEPRPNGTFAIMKPNAQRASKICDTQHEAIEASKALFPGVKPDIARVKHTNQGKPDQFRKR